MLEDSVSRNSDWIGAWVGNEMMLMSCSSGVYLSLSETGGRVWELLETPHGVDSLCDLLLMEYGTAPSGAREEIRRFLNQLAAEKIISFFLSAAA